MVVVAVVFYCRMLYVWWEYALFLSVNYKEIWMIFKKKDLDFNITLYMVIAYIKC